MRYNDNDLVVCNHGRECAKRITNKDCLALLPVLVKHAQYSPISVGKYCARMTNIKDREIIIIKKGG